MNELIDESLHLLDDPSPQDLVESIHETRKNCKKGRGLARLVRPALGKHFKPVNRDLRDAARALGPTRDPHALLETFDDLVAASSGQIPPDGVLGVRQELADSSEAATEAILTHESDHLEEARALLNSAQERAGEWNVPHESEPLADGMAKTYKRGRNRLGDVLEAPHDAAFHEWRKRVKYLWYQVRLLRNSAPSLLRPLARRLHDLSDALGDAHDLALLREQMHTWDRDDLEDEVEAVDVLAAGRKRDLEERAVSLGLRLYVEKPDSFAGRVEGYWDVWQRRAPRKAGELEDLHPPDDELADRTVPELRELATDAGIEGRSDMRRDELEKSLRAAGI